PGDPATSPAEQGSRSDSRRSHPCDAERRVGRRVRAPEGDAAQSAPVTGFLVDTNVLSEARKANRAHPRVVAWINAHREELFLSVLVTGEIRRGIESVRGRDPAAAAALERWLREVETSFEERILPVDAPVADRWGRLMAERTLPTIDGLLAAT